MVDMIQINDLKFSYPDGSAALRGVSLSVKPGEFVTLCGLSGCGKSTLLRLMKPGLFPRGAGCAATNQDKSGAPPGGPLFCVRRRQGPLGNQFHAP